MISTLVVVAAVIAVLAALFIAWCLIDESDEIDRQLENARINRERQIAEARINHLTLSALQQMTAAAAPHSAFCQCARCVRPGGQS
ncbi:hypothetical protein AYK61_15400 [Rhodococcus sp. SBT000017]|uniref:hypothetical protein n=1 Tax=Rhodococcus sp. SBT000017 TaxID=1803385 RepID=UPI000EF8E8C3|nr:hypothetical protein [Rhodococcus sp. SBT000017]RMB77651.1 hypothetical protein AYK61_15400 [Rhodococcus sp. SBT000017]